MTGSGLDYSMCVCSELFISYPILSKEWGRLIICMKDWFSANVTSGICSMAKKLDHQSEAYLFRAMQIFIAKNEAENPNFHISSSIWAALLSLNVLVEALIATKKPKFLDALLTQEEERHKENCEWRLREIKQLIPRIQNTSEQRRIGN